MVKATVGVVCGERVGVESDVGVEAGGAVNWGAQLVTEREIVINVMNKAGEIRIRAS